MTFSRLTIVRRKTGVSGVTRVSSAIECDYVTAVE